MITLQWKLFHWWLVALHQPVHQSYVSNDVSMYLWNHVHRSDASPLLHAPSYVHNRTNHSFLLAPSSAFRQAFKELAFSFVSKPHCLTAWSRRFFESVGRKESAVQMMKFLMILTKWLAWTFSDHPTYYHLAFVSRWALCLSVTCVVCPWCSMQEFKRVPFVCLRHYFPFLIVHLLPRSPHRHLLWP